MAIAVISAPVPAPKAKAPSAYKQSEDVKALVDALTSLPADGVTALAVDGKSAKGVTLVAGKILTKLGFIGRFEVVNDTTVKIWKLKDDAALAARTAAKAKRKEAKAAATVQG